jgi:hypothetical protein
MAATWTLVFDLGGLTDDPEDVARTPSGVAGAALQRALAPGLHRRGWAFAEAFPEDYGWFAQALGEDRGRLVTLALVAHPEGEAQDGRWRLTIGLDLGLLPATRARRAAMLKSLAGDLQAECEALGARALVWEGA